MKGFRLACGAACALFIFPMSNAHASAPAPRVGTPHGVRSSRAGQVHIDGNRDRRPRAEIGLGEIFYGSTSEPATDSNPYSQPEIVVAPVYVSVEARPDQIASTGPRIIYVGREKPREHVGAMPQIIYGDLPSRASRGPEIIYGDSWR